MADEMARFTIRVPDGMKAELQRIAEQDPMYTDMSDVGRDALRQFIVEHDLDRREVAADA